MKGLILVKRVKSFEGGKGDFYKVFNKKDGKLYKIWCIRKYEIC